MAANDDEEVFVENDSPIIGVLAQEIAYSLEKIYPGQYHSFIAASYVKFIEGGGGRVVPVWIGRDKQYYKDIVNKTNGILFPGGATWFNQSQGYADAGVILYNLAVEQNLRGDYYPIFGTCLGMELIIYAAAGAKEYRADCSARNIGLPLEFKSDFRNSKMFGPAPSDIIDDLSKKNITSNFHRYCLTEQNLTSLNLANDWHVLSTNKDVNGFEFVSTIESRKYPFFGVQFHPEKHLYEWKPKKGILHTKEAIKAAQYLAQMFIDETRQSNHTFGSRAAEQTELIYNYPITYTGLAGNSYEQCYLFKENVGTKVLDSKPTLAEPRTDKMQQVLLSHYKVAKGATYVQSRLDQRLLQTGNEPDSKCSRALSAVPSMQQQQQRCNEAIVIRPESLPVALLVVGVRSSFGSYEVVDRGVIYSTRRSSGTDGKARRTLVYVRRGEWDTSWSPGAVQVTGSTPGTI
ncbi:lethal (3) 72Dp [Carabus blaptoides fortunei]